MGTHDLVAFRHAVKAAQLAQSRALKNYKSSFRRSYGRDSMIKCGGKQTNLSVVAFVLR